MIIGRGDAGECMWGSWGRVDWCEGMEGINRFIVRIGVGSVGRGLDWRVGLGVCDWCCSWAAGLLV